MRLAPLGLLAFLLVSATPSLAQTPSCTLGVAEKALATPDLYANLFNTGSLFFGGSTTNGDGYLVPRARGRSPLFSASLWVGGLVDGYPRIAAARYTNFNFWPGPLDPGATLPDPSSCAAFDRIYAVNPADVAAYENGAPPAPDLADWPVGLGARTVDAAGLSVVPTSRLQIIDLASGERPLLYGGPTAFWVMNDAGQPTHPGTGSAPLGVEVRVTAFATDSGPEVLRQTTVYRYEIINRSSVPVEAMHVGFFVDPDLGNAGDDFMGADSTRGLMIAYNGDDDDDGPMGYGIPPALGFDLLGGSRASTTPPPRSSWPFDPPSIESYYFSLQGRWGDGTPMRANGDGYDQPASVPTTRYLFPGDPVTGAFWSERQPVPGGPANPPGDRRFLVSSPPLTLQPGATRTVDLAILFAQGADRFDSITRLRATSDAVQALYDTGQLIPVPDEAPPTPTALSLSTPRPNPAASGAAELTLITEAPSPARVAVLDVLGREVAVLLDGMLRAGVHTLHVSQQLPAGTYLIVATVGTTRLSRPLTVTR